MGANRTFIEKWIIETDGVLLAAVPFAGYLIAYSFEAGCCSYHNIPPRFIDLNFITIMLATAGAALYLYLFYLYIHCALIMKEEKRVIWHVMSRMMLCLLPLVILLIYSDGKTGAWHIMWIVVALIILYYFILPLFSQPGKEGYWLSVKQMLRSEAIHEDTGRTSDTNSLFDSLHSVIVPLALSIIMCFAIGRLYAKEENRFWVLDNPPNTIMLRKYGDYMVLKRYNPKNNEIEVAVQVRRISDVDGLSVREVDIGVLKTTR